MPPILPRVTRKYFNEPTGTSVSAHDSRIARLVGPCRARAAVRSEMSSIFPSRPTVQMSCAWLVSEVAAKKRRENATEKAVLVFM